MVKYVEGFEFEGFVTVKLLILSFNFCLTFCSVTATAMSGFLIYYYYYYFFYVSLIINLVLSKTEEYFFFYTNEGYFIGLVL